MSNEDQAKRMLTATVNPAGAYEYTGEYYEACRCFLAGSDPSMPEKTLIHPDKMNLDRLLKVIKIAETKLKNVSAILRNPPASLSESQLKR